MFAKFMRLGSTACKVQFTIDLQELIIFEGRLDITLVCIEFQRKTKSICSAAKLWSEKTSPSPFNLDEALNLSVTLYKDSNGKFMQKSGRIALKGHSNVTQSPVTLGFVNLQLHALAADISSKRMCLLLKDVKSKAIGTISTSIAAKYLGDVGADDVSSVISGDSDLASISSNNWGIQHGYKSNSVESQLQSRSSKDETDKLRRRLSTNNSRGDSDASDTLSIPNFTESPLPRRTGSSHFRRDSLRLPEICQDDKKAVRITELELLLESLNNQRAEDLMVIEQTEKKVQLAEEINARLTTDLDLASSTLPPSKDRDLLTEKLAISTEYENTKKRNLAISTEIEITKKQLMSMTAEKATLKSDLQSSKMKETVAVTAAAVLQSKLDAVQSEKAVRTAVLSVENTKLKEQIGQLKESAHISSTEKSRLLYDMESLKSDILDVENKSKQITELTENKESLTQELFKTKQTGTQSRDKVDTLQVQINDLKDLVLRKEEENKTSKSFAFSNTKKNETDKADMQKKLTVTQSKLDIAVTKLETTNIENTALESETAAQNTAIIADLTTQLYDLQKREILNKESALKFKIGKDGMKKELQLMSESIMVKSTDINLFKKQLKKTIQILNNATKLYDNLESVNTIKCDELTRKINAASERLLMIGKKCSSLTHELSEERKNNTQLSTENNNISQELELKRTELKTTVRALQISDQNIKNQKSEVLQSKIEIENSRKTIERQSSDFESEINAKNKDFKLFLKEFDTTKNNLAEMKMSRKSSVILHDETIERIKRENEEVVRTLREEILSNNIAAECASVTYEEHLSNVNNSVAVLQWEIISLNSHHDAQSQSATNDYRTLQKELEHTKTNLTDLISQLSTLTTHQKDIQSSHNDDIAEYDRKLEESYLSLVAAKESEERMGMEVEVLQIEIIASQGMFDRAQVDKNQAQQKLCVQNFKLGKLKKESATERANYDEKISSMNKEREMSDKKQEDEVIVLTDNNRVLQETIEEEIIQNKEEMLLRNNELSLRNDELSSKNIEISYNKEEMRLNNDELSLRTDDFNNIQGYFEITRSDLEASRLDLEASRVVMEKITEELKGTKNTLEMTRIEVEKERNEAEMKKEVVTIQKEVVNRRREVERLTEQNSTLEKKVSTSSEELSVSLTLKNDAEAMIVIEKDKYEQLSSVLSQFREKMKVNLTKISENEKTITSLTSVNSENKNQISVLKNEINVLKEKEIIQDSELKKIKEIVTNNNEQEEKNNEKNNIEILELKSQLTSANELYDLGHEKSVIQMKEIETLRIELNDFASKYDENYSSFAQMEKTSTSEKEGLVRKTSELEMLHKTKEITIDTKTLEVNELNAKIHNLLIELTVERTVHTVHTDTIDTLNTQIATLQSDSNGNIILYKQQQIESSEVINERITENNDLKKEIDDYRTKINNILTPQIIESEIKTIKMKEEIDALLLEEERLKNNFDIRMTESVKTDLVSRKEIFDLTKENQALESSLQGAMLKMKTLDAINNEEKKKSKQEIEILKSNYEKLITVIDEKEVQLDKKDIQTKEFLKKIEFIKKNNEIEGVKSKNIMKKNDEKSKDQIDLLLIEKNKARSELKRLCSQNMANEILKKEEIVLIEIEKEILVTDIEILKGKLQIAEMKNIELMSFFESEKERYFTLHNSKTQIAAAESRILFSTEKRKLKEELTTINKKMNSTEEEILDYKSKIQEMERKIVEKVNENNLDNKAQEEKIILFLKSKKLYDPLLHDNGNVFKSGIWMDLIGSQLMGSQKNEEKKI